MVRRRVTRTAAEAVCRAIAVTQMCDAPSAAFANPDGRSVDRSTRTPQTWRQHEGQGQPRRNTLRRICSTISSARLSATDRGNLLDAADGGPTLQKLASAGRTVRSQATLREPLPPMNPPRPSRMRCSSRSVREQHCSRACASARAEAISQVCMIEFSPRAAAAIQAPAAPRAGYAVDKQGTTATHPAWIHRLPGDAERSRIRADPKIVAVSWPPRRWRLRRLRDCAGIYLALADPPPVRACAIRHAGSWLRPRRDPWRKYSRMAGSESLRRSGQIRAQRPVWKEVDVISRCGSANAGLFTGTLGDDLTPRRGAVACADGRRSTTSQPCVRAGAQRRCADGCWLPAASVCRFAMHGVTSSSDRRRQRRLRPMANGGVE